MKGSFLLLCLLYLNMSVVAQSWEAKIIVQHPYTYETDTAWIGYDINADYGYQEGYDVLDTHFYGKSIAIRGYDPAIGTHPEYCINLKRDIIKPQSGQVDFILYVHCDTFVYKPHPDSLNNIWMIWDTSDFLHSPAEYEVISAMGYSEGGYFYAMDQSKWCCR